MKLTIAAVYDLKAQSFDQPFTCHNAAVAEREYRTVLKDPKTKYGANPDDFQLYQLGYVNVETGEMEQSKLMIGVN